ncbi:SOS response-associated peptidase family protein [uncultured Erythrobacter sp.]|uniref:SOS response-associated peptidase family protein n=1 Tax=uncultured Erythrobacter sp. TaxID=263913 RepID=UPI00344F11FC
MTKSQHEIAHLFDAEDTGLASNFGEEVYPGYPGLVVAANGEGKYQVWTMSWGFPLAMTGKNGQLLKPKSVNNARTDKLGGFFWRASFERRRCLIPYAPGLTRKGTKELRREPGCPCRALRRSRPRECGARARSSARAFRW